MCRGAWAKAGGVQRLPLAAGAEHKENGLHTDAVGGAWPTAAEAMGILVLGNKQGESLPEVVRNVPLIDNGGIDRNSLHSFTLPAAAQK
jgi:hypothetical protein